MFDANPRQILLQRSCILVLTLLLGGCIERYHPDEEEVKVGNLVVAAHLTDIPGLQSISVSRSTTLELPSFDPVSNCHVEVEREDGWSVEFAEAEPGVYTAYLERSQLMEGIGYRLHIVTPEGERYESAFELLHPAVSIDSVYYTREDLPTNDPGVIEEGIRFQIDFEIDKGASRYLRWQLIETFEMHNPDYENTQVYDVDRMMKQIPDSIANRICWITREVPEIHTLDLGGVEGSIYRAKSLHFVSAEPQRLHHGYSLLVRQYSLGEDAFWYWDELGKNLQSKGNLFDTQPSITPSNICNVDDEDEIVIGFFSISGASEKRIVVRSVPGLTLTEDPGFCEPGALPYSFRRLSSALLPYYMATKTVDGSLKMGGVPIRCIDCREYRGSTHIKPAFWDRYP
jgi:hypothetical protein